MSYDATKPAVPPAQFPYIGAAPSDRTYCEKYLRMVMPRYQFHEDEEPRRFDLCTTEEQARVMGWWGKRLLTSGVCMPGRRIPFTPEVTAGGATGGDGAASARDAG